MDGIVKLWEEIFKVNPVFAIGILVVGIWHLFLKDLFRGSSRSDTASTSSERGTPEKAESDK